MLVSACSADLELTETCAMDDHICFFDRMDFSTMLEPELILHYNLSFDCSKKCTSNTIVLMLESIRII